MFHRRTFRPGGLVLGLCSLAALIASAGASPLQSLADQVQEFTLENGLRFLVVEQHDAPVFSYATVVDAGGVCEVVGTTGIAHMFEHMAFKGTETIGTSDFKKEQRALARVDEAWDAVLTERHRGFDADSLRLAELAEAYKQARDEAREFVLSNDYVKILESNGAQGVNAFTGLDITAYLYSLPSNRLELWARMESDRLSHPVLREFYTERDVVRNERRSSESSPTGRLFDALLTTSFSAHPYGTGVIGHSSDIENFHRRDALEFFDKYYVASNMTVCLVGDVTVDEVQKLAREYFMEVREAPDPPPVMTIEPVHTAELRIIAEEDANPVLITCWQAPAQRDPDFAAMELLTAMLGNGRTSRLYERLVKEEQVAIQVGAGVGLPGSKYPSLAGVFTYVVADGDPEEVEAMVYEEVEGLIASGPTDDELAKVKTIYRAQEMRQLRRPLRLAVALASADQMQGDWRQLFEHLDRVEQVTTADIQRVATEYLVRPQRIVAMIQKTSADAASASQ